MGRYAPTPVILISDATGALGEHVLKTVFTQFPPGSFRLRTINFVNTEIRLADCLKQLRRLRGLVVHSTVFPEFKRRIRKVCAERGLPVHDLTGPIVSFIAASSRRRPQIDYRKLHPLDSDYFRRITAIEFAIAHDDGAGLRSLREADVVLVGVSRTTKTPTSMVLATQGHRAANVPLVPHVEPPRELLSVEAPRVICLTTTPDALAAFRHARVQERFGGFGAGYLDEQTIRHELAAARRLSQQRGWRILEVTGRAVEETAARVIQMAGLSA